MLETVIVIVGVLLFIQVIWLISSYDLKRRRKTYIHEKFGSLPREKEWNDAVSNYYEMTRCENGIDDITWNDLSMNEVFQRINQCDTSAGEEILYWKLRRNDMSDEERRVFEECTDFYGRNEKAREKIEMLLCDIGKSRSSYYIPSYLDSIEEYMLQYPWIYRVLQGVLAVSAAVMIVWQNDRAAYGFLGVCVVNIVLYALLKMKNETALSMIGTAVSLLRNAKQIARQDETGEWFPELREALSGLRGVLRGERILRAQREGSDSGDALGMLSDYIMGATLWRLTTYNKVMKRLRGHIDEYLTVYRCIGLLDAAVSTASFRKTLSGYCTPEFTGEKRLEAEELFHPLLKNPVANDLELDRGCLITGSNASGKSTFIKAVVVNAILAQSLNTCAAKRLVMPHAEVLTSMAVTDDILAGESYFIREIRYLKRILDGLNDGRMMICAVDEILRGTNTGERLRASKEILEYLRDKKCIALVATHDKELTELLGESYKNYHFSEEIGEDDVVFSYRLMDGPATSQNAVKLLEYAGFPREIIDAAQGR